MEKTGLKKSMFYEVAKTGAFGRPVQLTERCVGYDEAEIERWMQSRLDARDA
jgi:predicted DNA-binding transcriptional regulator AlpA